MCTIKMRHVNTLMTRPLCGVWVKRAAARVSLLASVVL